MSKIVQEETHLFQPTIHLGLSRFDHNINSNNNSNNNINNNRENPDTHGLPAAAIMRLMGEKTQVGRLLLFKIQDLVRKKNLLRNT